MKMQVRINDHHYDVEIVDINARPIDVVVDGERIEVWPEEVGSIAEIGTTEPVTPIATTSLPKPRESVKQSNIVTAPLPGVIVSIEVKTGQAVTQGQVLCTLEAMKMKNSIRSNRDGIIAEIHVSLGELVKHGQALVSFTE